MNKNKVSILEFIQKHDKRLENIEKLLSLSKKVINIDELSILTGLSKSTIYKYTHTGKIPFYKKAKHLFFDRIEIENWLKSNRSISSAELENEAASYLTYSKKGGAK